MRAGIKLGIITSFLCIAAYGQTEFRKGNPLFPSVSSWFNPDIDQAQLNILSTLDQPKNQPYQFALPVPVSLNPDNAGFKIRASGEIIWVMPVASKGALSLNATLQPFDLPDGAYLYVYDVDHKVIRGAYTNESNAGSEILPLLPVPGDRMVIECHFPGNTIPGNAIGITQVAHDFAGFFDLFSAKDGNFGRSGSCEVDINCTTDEAFLTSARSVCRLLIRGSLLCTGALINNTGAAYRAYLLTAQHCEKTSLDAQNTVVLFNYASPWCDGVDQSVVHSISGTTIKATYDSLDFSLLELSSFPSLVFKPYFSGWNITLSTPSSTYAIHHPEGDVMKLSRDNDSPVISSFPVKGYKANAFWKILRWDLGSTEEGSSGCPLFDQNDMIVGTLTGGYATCSLPTLDYFARLRLMFTSSGITAQNLTSWLDPAATGATLVSGRDPFSYNLSTADTLVNIPRTDSGQTNQYSDPGFGYSTGFNSDSIISYAEYFPFTGSGEITWVHLKIAKASLINSTDSVVVSVLQGGAAPGAVIASRIVRIEAVKDDYDLEVDFGATVPITGPFYIGYRIFYKNPLGAPQPQFAVKHSQLYSSEDKNTAWFNDGAGWKSFSQHPSFPMYTSLAVNAIIVDNSDLNPVNDVTYQNNTLAVYPNPFVESISFDIKTNVEEADLTIFNNAGSVVFTGAYHNIFPGILTADLPALVPGIYYFRLKADNETYSGTIIKTDVR